MRVRVRSMRIIPLDNSLVARVDDRRVGELINEAARDVVRPLRHEKDVFDAGARGTAGLADAAAAKGPQSCRGGGVGMNTEKHTDKHRHRHRHRHTDTQTHLRGRGRERIFQMCWGL